MPWIVTLVTIAGVLEKLIGSLRSLSLPRHVARPLQLSASLMLLSLSVLFVADFLNLREDPRRSIHESRKAVAAALVEQLSTVASVGTSNTVEKAVADFAARSADTQAVALILHDGRIPVRRGDFALLQKEPGLSGGTRLDVPIFRNNAPWGEVRIAFAPYGSAQDEFVWFAFVAIGFLASFGLFLGKVLVQLDPGRAVPERVDSAFDLFSAGVVILDEGLRIVMINHAGAAIVERPSEAMTGLSMEEAFDWQMSRDWQAPWVTTLHSGLVASDQMLRLRGAAGESRLYSVSCAPVGSDSTGRRGVLVTLDDMTLIEQKNTELATTLRELRHSRDAIEARNVQLELLATTDPLTGIANRRTLLERLDDMLEHARTEGAPLSCIMTDIDHFKQVNDTYGHPAGDAVIRAVADALQKACRENDLVARYGGEEFVLLLPGLDAEAAFDVAERVRIAVIALAADDELPVPTLSASFGVAERITDLDSVASILDAADQALYVAKQGGRNRVSIHGCEGAIAPVVEMLASVSTSDSDQALARLHELEAKLRKSEREIVAMREFDTLTGVPMHVLFLQRVTDELVRAERTGSLLGVMSFELRDLGRVVSTFGHAASDALVVAFVERLQAGLRSSDLVSRITADHSLSRITSNEYGVLLSDLTDAGSALIVVARLRRLLSQPFMLDGDKIYLGANIGIVLSSVQASAEAAALFEQASEARAAAASKAGKVTHAFASADLDDESHDYIRLESDLHDALETGALETYFQPKFDLATRRVTGMETLLRWNHETRGFVRPDVFVAVAEANGLIQRLSNLVLDRTLEQILVWRSMGFDDLRVSINVSPMQLRAETLVDDTIETLKRHGVAGRQLEIELTETSVLDCPEDARQALQRLREAGVGISIDDFGTGYTSLSLLADLPLDTIKIDRSLVVAMAGGERHRAVVESIITMAHALKLRVVGEGVETNEQLETMAQLGCDEIQGYLISRPLPADEITAFLVHQRAERDRRQA